MFKNALISVSDKTGLIEFLTPFKQGLRIVSTGGTAKHLRENGFTVVDISEQTNFPEVMDGRVKTLHPHVHMALLGRKDKAEHQDILKKYALENFDLLICNLYPFEQAVLKNLSFEELIENIDIGGPSMLRSAAKNFHSITVVCDPNDYAAILQNQGSDLNLRQYLAAKVFAHTSVYDSLVAKKLQNAEMSLQPLGGQLVQNLRYGENPQQKAAWYSWPGDDKGLHTAKILQGKELSYNNILDLDAASQLVRQFKQPACVAVKHNNPCGVGMATTVLEACQKALSADPVSVFGGIIAFNKELDLACAQALSPLFLECIVAPSFSSEAKAHFANKKNLRLLEWPQLMNYLATDDYKSIAGGFIKQSHDQIAGTESWNFLGERPSDETISDMIFGEKVCATLKSNAIALVAQGQTVGLGMGQVNRVEAVEHALTRMKNHHPQINTQKVVLISDAFFPFSDSIKLAAQFGIKWVVQPGGSIKDEEVIRDAKSLGIQMVMTGQRHFRH